MVIKYVTACGCEKLKEESYKSPPHRLMLALYQPLRIGDFDPEVDMVKARFYRRNFEFFNTESGPTGLVFIYREVLD